MVLRSVFFVIPALSLFACTAPVSETSGKHLYEKHCTSCHGSTAKGDGPLAGEFTVPPSDLTTLQQNNNGVFPAVDVMAQINGYSGRHQFGGMPEFEEDLQGKTVQWKAPSGVVIPTPRALLDIAVYLESIQE
ncbi:c-type cytochrome [Sulfitobacter donghicola]|uniref:Cytochrome c domain-containing protein n=1 Tax=Sulfitobacter donghicola DSW-25 = KCTC 12864 = JCM 14565 TaxID=1300350 RepID=A0A073IFF8_9RHOB|nr:c-type cytochrome [Sulfitobacter donghicola]KEJ88236.1 hypothetical protein DSW25_16305 [Sulfitobacter donghicola DSW-25 = KCTC 12864 = JCM 14565]KIN68830.1 Class I monoheme cytochrome c [Sulfitobacter donghicola DSW-25 = KCTC 12864 = JCM 14565]